MDEPKIKPYVIPTMDQILMREYLTGIMLGEPEPFFDFLRNYFVEHFEALQELRTQMETGSVHNQHMLEEIWMRQKPMHDDLLAWLLKYDPHK